MPHYRHLDIGDPAPWFKQSSTSNPNYSFDTAAGRYIVMCFVGSTADETGKNMLRITEEYRDLFNDQKISFFSISIDPTDKSEKRLRQALPGIRHFWDFDYKISHMYGATPESATGQDILPYRRMWLVLNPALRIRAIFPGTLNGEERHQIAAYLKDLPPVDLYNGMPVSAPVLSLTDVFEPALCSRLIDLYEAHGGEDSGFMREIDGRTVPVMDYGHKKRSDFLLEDEDLRNIIQNRIKRRIVPEIKKIHQFDATRMERYIVACYDGREGGHFRQHRDNTTKGTAHRRFAVSINLNNDFEGGELSFPEYGNQKFKPQVGAAIVFSCSMLHTVTPVTSGRRYAFLPFLYDEAASAIRESNNAFLDERIGTYSPHPCKAENHP